MMPLQRSNGASCSPGDAMLWNNKGYALYRLSGNHRRCLTACDKMVSLDGTYTTALINRGDALMKMGRSSEAVAAYTRANET